LRLPRPVRLARFATAGVRFLNGYLILLIAFSLREGDEGLGTLAVLLGATGLGYFLSAWAAPTIGKRVREEPMVVGALAVIAISAFVGAQLDSLTAAAVLVAAAGFAWGTAKFAFDGMMHTTVSESDRARAFTNSETIFQIAWVIGALIPVLPFWPRELGLFSAGVAALVIQVAYVSLVLLPDVSSVRPEYPHEPRAPVVEPRPGVLDLF
jgi:predicted MFS family arabinose efflux permease